METEELTKVVDGIYKNILDKFNPGARQLIQAGKAYLKALQGAAAASSLYVEAIGKLARQAQQASWGGSSDIGSALNQVVEVYKEIQSQQINILKAFYVDLLVPLETNLEKDTKVVQSEQKRFLQQHKQRCETYSKAAAAMKKQRKKSRGASKTGIALDKELKNMQVLEEEKTKLDDFCEESLKTAMTQERRRYGFVLERQCSLAKHYLAYHTLGGGALQRHLDGWQEVAGTREFLPDGVDAAVTGRIRQVNLWADDDAYAVPRSPDLDDDRLSLASQLRKTKSMDASCLDVRCINDAASPLKPLSRAKSDFNLASSTHSLESVPESPTRHKPLATSAPEPLLARALYAYLSSGDNQLSFHEGDVIALIGERNKGWQFGENIRTQNSGWFPFAYTEVILDYPLLGSPQRAASGDWACSAATTPATPPAGAASFASSPAPSSTASSSSSGVASAPGGPCTPLLPPAPPALAPRGPDAQRRPAAPAAPFADSLLLLRGGSRKMRVGAACASAGPPPPLPAPAPAPRPPSRAQTLPGAGAAGAGGGGAGAGAAAGAERRLAPPPMPPLPSLLGGGRRGAGSSASAAGSPSLHSSNDSGFSNEAQPPQVDADDYDDDAARANVFATVKLRRTATNDRSAPFIS